MKTLAFVALFIGISHAALTPNPPGDDCPAVDFTHSIESVGEGLAVLKLNTKAEVDWIDLHLELDGVQSNHRLEKVDELEYQHGPFPLDAVAEFVQELKNGKLSYFFTICQRGIDCDTDVFEFQPKVLMMPCPVISPPELKIDNIPGTDMLYRVQLRKTDQPLSLADLHLCIIAPGIEDCNEPEFNFRMKMVENGVFETRGIDDMGLELFPGEKLKHFASYCLVDQPYCCEQSAWAVFNPTPAPEPIEAPYCPIDYEDDLSHDVVLQKGTVDNYVFTFSIGQQLGWSELHVCIDDVCDHPQYNYRMDSIDGGITWVKNIAQESYFLRPGQLVNYFFTFCSVDKVDCDTQWFTKVL